MSRNLPAALAAILVSCWVSACTNPPDNRPPGPEMNDQHPAPPTVESLRDVKEYDGQTVVVRGTYHQVDLRKRPTGDPEYRGYVAVRLTDDHRVLIEPPWSSEAVRPRDELAAFDNRRVDVIGTVHEFCPPPPEPVAAIISPCIADVTAIELSPDD